MFHNWKWSIDTFSAMYQNFLWGWFVKTLPPETSFQKRSWSSSWFSAVIRVDWFHFLKKVPVPTHFSFISVVKFFSGMLERGGCWLWVELCILPDCRWSKAGKLMREFVEDEEHTSCCNRNDNAAASPEHLPPISMTHLKLTFIANSMQ